jgi:hypothetical protein
MSVNTRHATTISTTISWLRFIVLLTRRRAPCLFLATPTPRRRFQWLQNRIPVRKKERLAKSTGTTAWRSVLPNCACTSAPSKCPLFQHPDCTYTIRNSSEASPPLPVVVSRTRSDGVTTLASHEQRIIHSDITPAKALPQPKRLTEPGPRFVSKASGVGGFATRP